VSSSGGATVFTGDRGGVISVKRGSSLKRLTGSSYSLMGIMAITLAMVIRSLFFIRLQTKLMPIALGSLIFLLAAAELVRELRGGEGPKKRERPQAPTGVRA